MIPAHICEVISLIKATCCSFSLLCNALHAWHVGQYHQTCYSNYVMEKHQT